MRSEKEFLTDSRDSWQESANHDKKQALASFAIAASGISLATSGAIAGFEGAPVIGIPAFLVGVAVSIHSYRDAKFEIERAMKMQGLADIKQHELDNLSNQQEN